MFEIKKIISSFILPPGCFIIIFLLLFIYLRRKGYIFSIIFFLAAFVIYIFSSPFIWKHFVCSIEDKINKSVSIDGDVIVIFGGGVSSFNDYISETKSIDFSSSDRLFTGYRLHLKTSLPIILSGGKVFNQDSFAEVSKKLLISIGVKENYIFVDNLSRDTFENVKVIKDICKEKGYKKLIIVSDAIHIPRICLLLKKNNIDLSVYPSKYLCSNYSWRDLLPGDMLYSRALFYELFGYLYYSLIY